MERELTPDEIVAREERIRQEILSAILRSQEWDALTSKVVSVAEKVGEFAVRDALPVLMELGAKALAASLQKRS